MLSLSLRNFRFEETKCFEIALAEHLHDSDRLVKIRAAGSIHVLFDSNSPNCRWHKIALRLPHKEVAELQLHFRLLEASSAHHDLSNCYCDRLIVERFS